MNVEEPGPEVNREKEEVYDQPILLPQSCQTGDEEAVPMLWVVTFMETFLPYQSTYRLKKMNKKMNKH